MCFVPEVRNQIQYGYQPPPVLCMHTHIENTDSDSPVL